MKNKIEKLDIKGMMDVKGGKKAPKKSTDCTSAKCYFAADVCVSHA